MYQDDPTPTTSQMHEAKRLYKRWSFLFQRKNRVGSVRADHEEDAAYNELIDYVEANDLNHSEFDPR